MTVRIAQAQLNLLVGDIEGNAAKVIAAAVYARDVQGAHAIVFPELTLTSYPPEDLLLRPGLDRRVLAARQRVAAAASGIDIVVGYPVIHDGKRYNAAGVYRDGSLVAEYHKALLPNYSVFDEKRYFEPGGEPCVVEIAGIPVGLTICEDIWYPLPAARAAEAGARLLVNLNASPFHTGKAPEREELVAKRAAENGIPVVYVNLVGGQDELVFDGGSFVVDASGAVVQRSPFFRESRTVAALDTDGDRVTPVIDEVVPHPPEDAAVYEALVLGVRDYVNKNGFKGTVLGLSGGVDSAVTLTVAVDALGADQVEAVLMPSRYTSRMSVEDAEQEACNLGVKYRNIDIEPAFQAFLKMLEPEFHGLAEDATEENIQARCRGIVLMAISNKTGRMLLTTGNKSEMSVGYATLYGDMAGGFAPLKDVPKTLVYRLAAYRNREREVIPRRVLEREPSAELRADQKDTDSLPPYDILDPILQRYVEQDFSIEEIIAQGFDAAAVRRIARMVDLNEYKRRQAPPGIKITRRAFGRDRRYPICNGY